MRIPSPLKLFIAIAVSQGAGLLGSLFTFEAIPTWYATLTRPALSPPNWVFGPVWTTLFFLMGISAFLVWQKGLKRKDVRIALGIFLVQLVLNTLWSIIFFGWQHLGLACIEITLLWLAILFTIKSFWSISKPAAWLLIPYLLWVSFASYLTFAFWMLNWSF